MMPSDPLPAAGRNWNVGTGRVTWLPKAGHDLLMSQSAIAPRGIAYWPRAALPMLPSAPPVAELG